MEKYTLPTGHLIVDDYSKGKLETLSIGDYGKSKNVKADFLGYRNEINGVPSGDIMPLSEKWVITLSTQYGCPMKCNFCDVPKIGFNGNATPADMKKQLMAGIRANPAVNYTERLNIHFARMGEPLFNTEDVYNFTAYFLGRKEKFQSETGLRVEVIHPVLTSMVPHSASRIGEKLRSWTHMKNDKFNGQAGLQLSINSTNEKQRDTMFDGMQLSLDKLGAVCETLPMPLGRKYCLNFAYSLDYDIDGEILKEFFDPEMFMCKITPIHNNLSCRERGIGTIDGYKSYSPYRAAERSLKDAGFDVLVFVPSMDEENGLITCGNAILSGSEIKC
jgi:23S rRNA (adenine2503-C2)-methyltransferase